MFPSFNGISHIVHFKIIKIIFFSFEKTELNFKRNITFNLQIRLSVSWKFFYFVSILFKKRRL